MGFSSIELNKFAQSKSPTDALLTAWRAAGPHTIAELQRLLEQLGQAEALRIISRFGISSNFHSAMHN